MYSYLKYKLYRNQDGGTTQECKYQSTEFLQQYYDKNITKLKTPNLSKNDNILQYKDNSDVNVVYGEPCAYEIDNLIQELNINENDVFYDLGSGNGNVCATVLFGSSCKKAVGIELSDTRHNEAIRIKNQIYKNHPDKTIDKQLIFINDNFMNYNYEDATIVFMDSVLFENKTINNIEKKLKNNPNIRYFISMKNEYTPIFFKYIKTLNIKASWGSSRFNIYTRL